MCWVKYSLNLCLNWVSLILVVQHSAAKLFLSSEGPIFPYCGFSNEQIGSITQTKSSPRKSPLSAPKVLHSWLKIGSLFVMRHKLKYNSFHCLSIELAAQERQMITLCGHSALQAWLWPDITGTGWLLGAELCVTLQPDKCARQKSCSWLKTNIEHGKKMSKDKQIKCDMSEGFPQYKSHMWEAWA